MSLSAITVSLPGLTHLEADELASVLRRAGADVTTELDVRPEATTSDRRHHEPFALLAVVTLGQITLTALAIYLAKERKRGTRKVHLRYRSPTGEELEYTLEVDVSSEEAIRSDLLKQIAALKIPMPKELGIGSCDG
jgi:hypothetical protein